MTLGRFLLICLFCAPAAAQSPVSTSLPSDFDQQRFNDLIAIIEGQNSAQARRTGARELLLLGWQETPQRLAGILGGSNKPARIAVSQALSDYAAGFDLIYMPPLIEMLRDADPDLRQASGGALAAASPEAVLPRLRTLALSKDEAVPTRLAAISTLGMMTQREAAGVLIALLDDAQIEIADAALKTIEQATAQDFHDNAAAARAWWENVRRTPKLQWQHMQIQRLIRENQARQRDNALLEQRLAAALRDIYTRSAEAQRPVLLGSFLSDSTAAVRQMGLTLSQSLLAEGKVLPKETIELIRLLLKAEEPEVRASAVGTVVTLRDPNDAGRMLQLLKGEYHREVRGALVNGIGHLGDASSVAPLLELLQSTDATIETETVTALGRIAARGATPESLHEIASVLLAYFAQTPSEQSTLRERLLWAMSCTGDPRCGRIFVACLAAREANAVRLASVRGIAILADPRTKKLNGHTATSTPESAEAILTPVQMVDALPPATTDADAAVRRAAVEALSQFGSSEAHLEALWVRFDPTQEADETIRLTAWRGLIPLLASKPFEAIAARLDQLPGDDEAKLRYSIELLQAAEQQAGASPDARGRAGLIRKKLAENYLASGQLEPALSTYLTALEDLRATGSPEATSAATALLRLALTNDRYDARIADAFKAGAALNGAALWASVRDEIDKRLNPDGVDQAIAMIAAFQANPPASMPAETNEDIDQLLARARDVRSRIDAPVIAELLLRLNAARDDVEARAKVVDYGWRAAPAIRLALRTALEAAEPDDDWTAFLHALLKEIQPDWPGFAEGATMEEKLQTLE